MTPPPLIAGIAGTSLFAADVLVTAAAAWLVVCALGLRGRGLLEAPLAWWLSLSGLVGGAGVLLGETGGLGAAGYLAVHAAALAALAAARRRFLGADLEALAGLCARARRFLNSGTPQSAAALCLLLALAALAAVAAWSQPATADALSYHLPRMGQWLEDGRITVLPTADARMNYTAVVPELVMAWLLGISDTGFRPADLVQAIGGVMAVGSTVGLAREAGLGRGASVMAGALLLGMANVAVQFTASQTDLFTAGVFASAFYLWVCALRRREASVLGGAGLGLALGAKGTLFYLAPGALVWVAFMAWRHRPPPAAWRRTLAAALLGVALFALPGFARNWRAYGSPLGPKQWVEQVHQGAASLSGFAHKLQWNLTCSLAQVFEPQSQPLGLRSAGRSVVRLLARHVPAGDPYTYAGMSRTERLQNAFLHRAEPDADFASFGIVALALLVAGTAAALAAFRRPDARMIVAWSGGVAAFVLFFHAVQQWHPYAYRYFVLAAPWVAVVGAWGIERLPGAARAAAWILVLGAAANVAWRVTAHSYQSGWRAAVQPESSLTYFASRSWGDWSEGLAPATAPLTLCLPYGAAAAGFYREPAGRRVSMRALPGRDVPTAEEFVRGEPGWVVVAPALFLGREGRVAASVWLFNGDPGSPFSVAAYRRLAPGEVPAAVLYGDARAEGPRGAEHQLLVKTWDARPVSLRLSNPAGLPVSFRLSSPLSQERGWIPAGGVRTVALSLPPERVSQVRVVFEAAAGGIPSPEPAVALGSGRPP